MVRTKTVFITGIAGFLGCHLAKALVEEGYRVMGCDNLLGGDLMNVPSECGCFVADCRDLEKMTNMIAGADIVIHCAATAYEGYSMCAPSAVTSNIYDASVTVATAAIRNKVKRFIFCSSRSRYGGQQVPFTEDMPTRPKTPYGIAKVAAEQTLKQLCDFYGMELVIAVPHAIIGPKQKYDDPYRNVASIFINRMLQGKQPIIYGDGNQIHSFSPVADCVPCVVKMCTKRNVVGEIINIGPDEKSNLISVNDLATMIAQKLHFDVDPIHTTERPNETRITYCSSDKARRLLGYKTAHTVEETIDEMIAWITHKGPKEFTYHVPVEIHHRKTPQTWAKRLI